MSFGDTYLTVLGWIGSEPDFKETRQTPQITFRLGSTPRQFEKALNGYVDKPTTWYTVQCWRGLARNAFESVKVGQPVIVTGRLRTHEWTDNNGEQHSRVVLEAFSLGHDLNRGTTSFARNTPRADPNPFVRAEVAEEPADAGTTPYPPDEYSATPLPLSADHPAEQAA